MDVKSEVYSLTKFRYTDTFLLLRDAIVLVFLMHYSN